MKKLCIASLLMALSTTASAQWVGGIGYSNLSDDYLNLGAFVGSLRYDFSPQQQLHGSIGARYGIGIQEDTAEGFGSSGNVGIKLDRFMSVDLRGQYEVNDSVYFYVAPSFANAKLSASYGSSSLSDSSWEFGGGVGLGIKANETSSIEFSYESFDGTDVISANLVWQF